MTIDGSAVTGRSGRVERQTRETRISLSLNLDGSGDHQIQTGLGFFDHMLAQVAVHGLFDLQIDAQGDLEVDAHHTVEDVGLTLGEAFNQALGDRKGIVRMASAAVPMDDSLAYVVIDLSGRPYTVFQANWQGPAIGVLPTSLIGHFFESFAVTARCNLHARALYGKDDHHQAEALFKAFGRALDAATLIDPRRAAQVPSSKGVV
jgi:imidazoleglycerol-phosphate dehydratase